jgi:hypothetical protein
MLEGMTCLRLFLAAFLILPACSSSSSGGEGCPEQFPAAPDAGRTVAGCYAGGIDQICEVGTSGTSCTSPCTSDEQSVACVSGSLDSPPPTPDASLGCRVLTIPTPAGRSFYCCPCSSQ